MSSPRLLTRLLLVFTLVVSTQGLLLIQGTYLLRQDYVASVLCVNRFNPDSDCNGKCYLKQQMEHHANSHHSHDGDEHAPALLDVALRAHALVAYAESVELTFPIPANTYVRADERSPDLLLTSGIFHPPRIG